MQPIRHFVILRAPDSRMADVADDRVHLPLLRDITFRPVFIIAPHRSGTTILYKVLASSGCFNVVTAFDVVNRHRLMALNATGRMQEARTELQHALEEQRAVDEYGRPAKADNLEEYCYALDRQGRRPTLEPKTLPGFLEFCRKLQYLQGRDRPLLLKNPFDTANFVFLHRTFPEARFVVLHRDPLEVIDSQLRLIRWLLGERSPYDALLVERYRKIWESPFRLAVARLVCSPRLPLLFELVFRNVARGCNFLARHVDEIRDVAIELNYVDVCRTPDESIRRVLGFLGLAPPPGCDVAALIHRRDRKLLPEVERNRERVRRRTRHYADRCLGASSASATATS